MSGPFQGEVWWGEAPDAKGRPYLVITRDEAIPVLRAILVAPLSRTVRGIATELALGADEGLSVACAASLDNLLTFPKSMLARRMGAVAAGRRQELCAALLTVADC